MLIDNDIRKLTANAEEMLRRRTMAQMEAENAMHARTRELNDMKRLHELLEFLKNPLPKTPVVTLPVTAYLVKKDAPYFDADHVLVKEWLSAESKHPSRIPALVVTECRMIKTVDCKHCHDEHSSHPSKALVLKRFNYEMPKGKGVHQLISICLDCAHYELIAGQS